MVRRAIGRWLPSRQAVESNRALRWLAPLLSRPWLWQLQRRTVAVGAATGVFFGLLIPVVQIPLAALAVFALRGNLPVAVAGTLISNPLTYVPIWVLAHETGQWFLGEHIELPAIPGTSPLWDWSEIGWSLATGLSFFAVVGAVLVYTGVHVLWRGAVWVHAYRRSRRNHKVR